MYGRTAVRPYGARYYDPALGRFVQADTVVPEVGNPQALNRYSYVYNNPLRYTDPSGHWTFEEEPGDPYFIGPWLYEAQRRRDFITPREPTTGEFVAVATSPFWAPALAVGVTAPVTEGAAPLVTAAFKFAIAHPLEAAIAKAVAEEAFEATVTGTPFDPANVALDVLTQVGDEVVPRRGNPYGSRGGPAHSSVVNDIAANIRARKLKPRTEYKVDVLGTGIEGKRFRRVDVAALDVNSGKPVEFHQVGDITRSGRPVARERRAIIDITEFSEYTDVPLHFWPKRYR